MYDKLRFDQVVHTFRSQLHRLFVECSAYYVHLHIHELLLESLLQVLKIDNMNSRHHLSLKLNHDYLFYLQKLLLFLLF